MSTLMSIVKWFSLRVRKKILAIEIHCRWFWRFETKRGSFIFSQRSHESETGIIGFGENSWIFVGNNKSSNQRVKHFNQVSLKN